MDITLCNCLMTEHRDIGPLRVCGVRKMSPLNAIHTSKYQIGDSKRCFLPVNNIHGILLHNVSNDDCIFKFIDIFVELFLKKNTSLTRIYF